MFDEHCRYSFLQQESARYFSLNASFIEIAGWLETLSLDKIFFDILGYIGNECDEKNIPLSPVNQRNLLNGVYKLDEGQSIISSLCFSGKKSKEVKRMDRALADAKAIMSIWRKSIPLFIKLSLPFVPDKEDGADNIYSSANIVSSTGAQIRKEVEQLAYLYGIEAFIDLYLSGIPLEDILV